MANTIKFKRGVAANVSAATLADGEPAFDLTNGKLYVGNGTNKVLINPDNVPSASKLSTGFRLKVTGSDVMEMAAVSNDGTELSTIEVDLSTTGVAVGTYPKVTVDAKGRVKAGASLAAADIPTLTLSKISNAGTAAAANTGTAAGNIPVLDANGHVFVSTLPVTGLPAMSFNGNIDVNEYTLCGKHLSVGQDATIGGVAIATVNDVNAAFAANDAMVFKGTLGTNGTVTALPTSGYSAGWTYRVVTAGTYVAQTCEIGDMIICVKDYASAFANSDWTVVQTNETDVAHLTSPTFTGMPAAPTAAAATNTAQIATTAHVHSAIASDRPFETAVANIKMNGSQSVGTASTVARADHVHPTDTSRAPLVSPALSGTPIAPTASVGTSTAQIATTAFVNAQVAASVIDGGTL